MCFRAFFFARDMTAVMCLQEWTQLPVRGSFPYLALPGLQVSISRAICMCYFVFAACCCPSFPPFSNSSALSHHFHPPPHIPGAAFGVEGGAGGACGIAAAACVAFGIIVSAFSILHASAVFVFPARF